MRLGSGEFAFGVGGAEPADCPGTRATTETIRVVGAAGSSEKLTIDGPFTGGTDEPGKTDDSELTVDLGDAGLDTVVLIASRVADRARRERTRL